MIKDLAISLENESLERSIVFIKSITEIRPRLRNSHFYFEKLDVSTTSARLSDTEMTLEKYLDSMKPNYMLKLFLGKFPSEHEIRVSSRGVFLPESPRTERFAQFSCPLDQRNFDEVDSVFTNVYGRKIV